eukprot:SAG31_NODE_2314_length_5953_cov_1.996413_6_plen_124_part_00
MCFSFFFRLLSADGDLEAVDVELWKSLQYLRENEIDDQCLCLYFTASYDEFGVTHEDELKEGGAEIEVTDANKEEFIRLKTEWRLESRIKTQMEAVRRGFYQVMPEVRQIVFVCSLPIKTITR